MKAIYFPLAVVFALCGCAAESKSYDYSVDISRIEPAYNTMMERYEVVKSVATDKWDMFSEDEQLKLNLVANNVKMIEARVSRIRHKNIDNMEGCRVTVPELGYIHTLARDAYDIAHGIAVNHMAELTASEILTLQNFDIQLQDMDNKIKALTITPHYNDVDHILYSMLNISSAALKIILPVVLGRELYAEQEQ